MDISNKIILVTGASRGIGMAIASELSENGAIVIGTATSKEGASSISNSLSSLKTLVFLPDEMRLFCHC